MAALGEAARALLHVDMVESTQMLAEGGVPAQIAARRMLAGFIDQVVRDHGGAVVDSRGDGTLMWLPSASAALLAASDLQHEVNTGSLFRVRAGLTISEDATDDRARRVEELCPPGRVAVDGIALRAIDVAHGTGMYQPLDGASLDTDIWVLHAARETLAAHLTERSARLAVMMFTEAVSTDSSLGPEILNAHGGEIVDTNGSGHVALFESASAALAAGNALHSAAAAQNLRADVAHGHREAYRIGVSMGDVVLSEGAYFGSAVVEAARLLAVADGGATVCHRDVGVLAGRVEGRNLGPLQLKGFEAAVEAVVFDDHGPSELLALPARFSRGHRFGFVGRNEHLVALRGLWHEAVQGDVRASVVVGEEGAGKTRLVEELALEAHAAGAVVVVGSCGEQLARPFQSVVEALEHLAGLDEVVAEAVEHGTGMLAPMFEGAAGRSFDASPVDRVEMFAEVAAVLERVSSVRPVLVVIDDVQWATADSLQLLNTLICSTEPCRVMIVATCRGEALDRSHPVEEQLLSASRDGHRVDRRRLDRLGADDVVAMLESRSLRPLEPTEIEFAHTVAHVTGGSPLYTEELVTHLASTGVLVHGDHGWVLNVARADFPIPESLTSLMAERLARLGDDAVDVLTTAAVIGANFDLEVLAAVKGRPLEQILDVVDAAAAARLVFESPSGGECAFSDELVRAALLLEMRPSRRSVVHRRVAEVLDAERPHEIDQLAIHWDRASGLDAKHRAIDALRRVSERDMGSAAWESAVERLHRVVELLGETGVEDAATLGEVRYALGSALRTLGDRAYRPELVEAGALARRAGDGELLGRAAAAMMRPGSWFPEAAVIDHEIIEMCEDALLMLDAAAPMRAKVLSVLATNLAYHPDIDRRRALLHEAQQLAREHGDLQLIGATLVAEVLTEREPHRFERRAEVAAELRRIGRIAGDRDLSFVGGLFTLLEIYTQGRIDDGEPLLAELQASAEGARAYWHRFLMSHFRVANAILRCEPDAQEMCDSERDRFQQHEVDWFGVWTAQTGSIALANGTLSEMLLSLSEVSAAATGDDWHLKWNYAIARAHMEGGRFDEAVAAIEVNWDPVFDDYWLVSVQNLGLLGLEMKRLDWCEMSLERLMPYRGRLGIIGLGVAVGGQISTAIGQAALGLGDVVFAEELFRESVEQAESMRAPFFAANARRFLARTLLETDPQSTEALELIEANLASSRRFGFVLEESEAMKMRERIGATGGS